MHDPGSWGPVAVHQVNVIEFEFMNSKALIIRRCCVALVFGAIGTLISSAVPIGGIAFAMHQTVYATAICVACEEPGVWYSKTAYVDADGNTVHHTGDASLWDPEVLNGYRAAMQANRPRHDTTYMCLVGGFPFRCVRFWSDAQDERGILWRKTTVPIEGFPLIILDSVVWPEMILNLVFYTGMIGGVPLGWRAFRKRKRVRAGLCVECAYDLRGTVAPRCPECGSAIHRRAINREETAA